MPETEDLPNPWSVVLSKKPKYRGQAFIKRDDEFVIKVYANETFNAEDFANYLVRQMNRLEGIWRTREEATPR